MLLRKKDPNALDAPMSPAELAAARTTLGRTPAQFAEDVELTLYELEAMEAGRAKIPTLVAVMARSRVADHRIQESLAASGLPECEEGKRLAERLAQATDAMLEDEAWDETEESEAATAALQRHMESCALCIARREHSTRHAPPMRELHEGPFMRAMGGLLTLGERLPGPLRVPKGASGSGRRMGIGIAGFLSVFVAAIPVGIVLVASLARSDFVDAGKAIVGWLGISAAYFVGFYLAGWAWDLTRPLRHRFVGYVLRGALAWSAIYGIVALLMTAAGEGTLAFAAGFTLFMGGVGAVGGAGFWVWHRIRGKLPRPVAR